MDEKVLVVPARSIEAYLSTSFDPRAADAVIATANENPAFLPRSQVEQDESYKQIIPYVCVRHEESFILLQRTSKQSEKRLHNKFSLGIGGHINELEIAGGGSNLVYAGLLRELNEEITLSPEWNLTLLGTIYDDTTPVGRVHFGIVYELEATDQSFTLNEPDLMSAAWVKAADLSAFRERMETWSQILFENHIGGAPANH
jgi:predicted NUDIX family phosphoesterase